MWKYNILSISKIRKHNISLITTSITIKKIYQQLSKPRFDSDSVVFEKIKSDESTKIIVNLWAKYDG